jgi:dynein heavy chain, axonemal
MTIVSTMGNPGSGRNPVSERLLRHSMLFSMINFDQGTLVRIYERLMSWHLDKFNFLPEHAKTFTMIV